METVPGQLGSLMQLLQEGKLDVHLAHRGLNPSVNRLVLGMLTSSLFLGSSLLLSNKVPPLLFADGGPFGFGQISLLGLVGYVVSLLVGLRLIRAIYKSGHLDRADSDT
jgi:ubiquinone biosynthesis protein